MHSTSTSEPLLRVQELGLYFRVQYQGHQTWRDMFVQAAANPVQFFLKGKERLVLFDNLSFDVHRGERIGLLGVNGTGKTSLCRCISKIYAPSKGRIKAPRNVRAVFDTAIGIQPELTGRENAHLLVEFIYPSIPAEHRQIVDEALEFSELGNFIDVPYKFYSNGMQARLCLSLISARPCDLLMLDEVFDGADQFFRKKIAARIRQIIDQSGAVIFVSHSTEQILEVCNRALVLDKGKILFDGSPQQAAEVYSKVRS
jgi:ABC-2 type transport system ATP-binding protein